MSSGQGVGTAMSPKKAMAYLSVIPEMKSITLVIALASTSVNSRESKT